MVDEEEEEGGCAEEVYLRSHHPLPATDRDNSQRLIDSSIS